MNEIFRFRLRHILYVITQVAVCVGILGSLGVVVAVVVFAFWTGVYFVFIGKGLPLRNRILVVLGFFMAGSAILMPFVQTPIYFGPTYPSCDQNLHTIGLALQNYRNVHRRFPPAYFTDATGKPTHSWRVMILPFIDEAKLYEQYDFDEPWNGPNNSKLANQMPTAFECGGWCRYHRDSQNETSYLAVVGDHTMWPHAESRRLLHVLDGLSNTVQLVEAPQKRTPWLSPTDIEYNEAVEMLSQPLDLNSSHISQTELYDQAYGRWVVLADSKRMLIGHYSDSNLAADHLRIDDMLDDGLYASVQELPQPDIYERRLRYANIFRWLFFAGVSFLPGFTLYRSRNHTEKKLAQSEQHEQLDDP